MPLRWFSGEFRQRRFDLLTRLVVIFYNAAVIQQLMSYPHAFKVYLRLVEVAVVLDVNVPDSFNASFFLYHKFKN